VNRHHAQRPGQAGVPVILREDLHHVERRRRLAVASRAPALHLLAVPATDSDESCGAEALCSCTTMPGMYASITAWSCRLPSTA
jgi:hypothetical protein